jgi:hypothetical protein
MARPATISPGHVPPGCRRAGFRSGVAPETDLLGQPRASRRRTRRGEWIIRRQFLACAVIGDFEAVRDPDMPAQAVLRQDEEVRFALDSLLEGDGFEPPVPQQIRSRFRESGHFSHDGLTVSRPGTGSSNPSPSSRESRANLKEPWADTGTSYRALDAGRAWRLGGRGTRSYHPAATFSTAFTSSVVPVWICRRVER